MTTSTATDYNTFLQQKEQHKAVKQARVRVGISWLLHIFTVPPIVSLVYSIKTENYLPVLAATGAAVVGVPMAVDKGVTFLVVPPVTSKVSSSDKARWRRRQLGIFEPKQIWSWLFQLPG